MHIGISYFGNIPLELLQKACLISLHIWKKWKISGHSTPHILFPIFEVQKFHVFFDMFAATFPASTQELKRAIRGEDAEAGGTGEATPKPPSGQSTPKSPKTPAARLRRAKSEAWRLETTLQLMEMGMLKMLKEILLFYLGWMKWML